MNVTLPDGTVIRDVPDNITKAELTEKLARNGYDVSKLSASQLKQKAETYDPTEGMSGFEKFAAGTGKAMTDVARGAGQMVGVVSRKDVEESRARDKALMNTGAGMAGNVFGNIAAAVPTAFIPGANTATGAGLIGAGMGLFQPSTSTGETVANSAIGGVAGLAVPLAVTGYKTAKSFVEPFYQGGRNQILGRALNDAAGGKSATAIRNLKNPQQFVQGSMPTVGEAAGVPSLAATQRAAMAGQPQATNQLAANQVAQNEARQAALRAVSPDALASRSARESVAGNMYDQARKQGINNDMAEAMAPQIQNLMQRLPDDVVDYAKNLAKVNGVSIDGANSVNGLHWMKKAIDDKIGQAKRTGSNDMARAYTQLQNDFLNTLDEISPAYQQARQAYAQMSRPVNQADVLSEIGTKATNFRGDYTPAAFSRAASDKTAQSVTGMPNATMSSVLEPNQNDTVKNILADLLRSDFANTAGRGVGSDTVQKLAYTNMLNQAGVPSAIRSFAPAGVVGNLAQRAGQIAYKDANEKLAAQLAETMMNPQSAAQLMESVAITPQMQALSDSLRRGGVALSGSIPAISNAQK
jgi:hypothetical protein